MTAVSPGQGAMDRLRIYGEKELLAFMAEVKSKTNKDLLRILPNVDGFRADSVKGLPTRKRTMLAHFLKKGGTAANKAKADSAYYYFWRVWAEEHLPDVEGLRGLLSGIEKVASKDDETVSLEEAIEGLFRHLQEQSFLNKCSSETLNRLLLFSPFDISDRLERIVTSAKPEVAVERDRALSTLPERLEGDEELLRRLQERFGKLEADVADLSTVAKTPSVVELPTVTPDPQRLGAIEDQVAGLFGRLEEMVGQQQQTVELTKSAATRIKALEKEMAELEALWTDLDDRSRNGLEDLRRVMETLPSTFTDAQAPVNEKLTSPSPGGVPLSHLPHRAKDAKLLTSGSDAATMLASNLETIGLKPSGTLPFAQELLSAAVSSGSLFLTGSMASDVARVTVHSLGARYGLKGRIPVGYVDASRLDEDVERLLPGNREGAAILLLDRINNAPLEVLADALGELVRTRNILVIATLSQGLSSLPPDSLYLQFGPIFDTDALDWSVFPKLSAISAGNLSTLDAEGLGMRVSKGEPEVEGLLRLLRNASFHRTPGVERRAVSFLTTLEQFRKQAAPSSLQSAVYGWVLPLWRMLDLDVLECARLLDEGKVDADEADARLKLMLEVPGKGGGR